jgi:transmembrane sensor
MRTPRTPAVAPSAYLRVNERMALRDGSVVELKDGSRVVVEFSASERRVRLTGEAHFQVAKDAKRPFIVDANGVTVRAVGTAFNVRIDTGAVQVVVTEGKVSVAAPPAKVGATSAAEASAPALVTAGQQATVSLGEVEARPARVSDVSEAEVAEALEWQAPRLQFFETPLSIAVAEFNARNRVQMSLAQEELGTIPIGGTFRVDNVDGFVRLLEVTLELKAARRGDNGIVLMRAQ